MSNLPFTFVAIPHFFNQNGFLDPKDENYFINLAFLNFVFFKCDSRPSTDYSQNIGVSLEPYEFIIKPSMASECGLTENQFRYQIKKYVERGLLIKTENSKSNTFSCFKWNLEKIGNRKPKMSISQREITPKPTLVSTQVTTLSSPTNYVNEKIEESSSTQVSTQPSTLYIYDNRTRKKTTNDAVVFFKFSNEDISNFAFTKNDIEQFNKFSHEDIGLALEFCRLTPAKEVKRTYGAVMLWHLMQPADKKPVYNKSTPQGDELYAKKRLDQIGITNLLCPIEINNKGLVLINNTVYLQTVYGETNFRKKCEDMILYATGTPLSCIQNQERKYG